MANNRLYLRCVRCNEDASIARLSVGSIIWEPSRAPGTEYAAFLEKHTTCSGEPREFGILHVELVAEADTGVRIGPKS